MLIYEVGSANMPNNMAVNSSLAGSVFSSVNHSRSPDQPPALLVHFHTRHNSASTITRLNNDPLFANSRPLELIKLLNVI